jgi:DNA-binding transcriptional LysR family regulator
MESPVSVATKSTLNEIRLLRIFLVLMRERSVSKAAASVNLSQPTLSHALNRLRALFDDPLLLRTSGAMTPTTRGLELQTTIGELLNRFDAIVTQSVAFDPKTSRARLTIMAPEFATDVLAGPLVCRLRESAPDFEMEFVTTDPIHAIDMLEQGTIDYRLGWWPQPAPALKRKLLWTDRMCCIMCSGHPLLAGPLTSAKYFDARHVRVRRPSRSYSMASIDSAAAKAGRRMQICAFVQNAHTMGSIVAKTDLLGTLSERLADRLADADIERRPLPFDVPSLKVALYWHERTHNSPVHKWFRALLVEVAKDVDAERPKTSSRARKSAR